MVLHQLQHPQFMQCTWEPRVARSRLPSTHQCPCLVLALRDSLLTRIASSFHCVCVCVSVSGCHCHHPFVSLPSFSLLHVSPLDRPASCFYKSVLVRCSFGSDGHCLNSARGPPLVLSLLFDNCSSTIRSGVAVPDEQACVFINSHSCRPA